MAHVVYTGEVWREVSDNGFLVQILYMYASVAQPDKACIIASTDVGRFVSEYEDKRFEYDGPRSNR